VSGAVALVFAGGIGFAFAFSGVVAFAFAGAFALLFSLALATITDLAFSAVLAFIVSGVIASQVAEIDKKVFAHGRQGAFFALYLLAMIVACFLAAPFVPPVQSRLAVGPLVLFMGLLTLLNAPFDWASLGLTRALLRRGLELGGWWPYLLALVDACLAGIIIALLALTMVIGVQAFDELAMHGGGEKAAVLPLGELFEGIAKNPGAPEYWWVYALLLSTMIPSLINLAIGGMALTRGVPGISRLLLHWIPEGRDVPDYRRPLAALALTIQMFAGAFLGIAAQALLAFGLLYYLMPAIGLDLLWLCQQLAGLDLPGTFFRLTGIIP
jgi:hypothetical protein